MFEKRLAAVSPQSFIADGTSNGIVTVANATLFKVKQEVRLKGTSLPQAELEVKSVINLTQLIVGPRGGNINSTINISAYTMAASATIDAPVQKRPSIDYSEIWRAVYDEEPTVALRNILVDKMGNRIDSVTDNNGTNRVAVDIGSNISVSVGSGLAPANFDDVKIIKNANGDPIQYQFYLSNASVGNIDVTYDQFGAAEYKKA